jgi:PAS domain S-box-containing protein
MPRKASENTPRRAGRGTGSKAAKAAAGRSEKALLSEVKVLRSHCGELDLALAKSRRANDELRRTLANYRLLFADTLNPIFVINDKGQFLSANPAALHFVECNLRELKKKRPWELAPPDKRSQQKSEYSTSMSRRTAEMEFLINGKLKTLLLNFLPLTLGKFSLLFAVGQDLTERKLAEQALRDSEANARALLNAPTDSVFLIDRLGKVHACNETGARKLGMKPSGLVGAMGYEIADNDTISRRRPLIEKVFDTGKPVRFQDKRQGMHFDTVVYPVFDASGNVVRAAVVARDITELELARRELDRKEAMLAEAEALAHLGSWERDIATGHECWSDEQYRLFGFEPGQVEPNFELFLNLVHPDDRERIVSVGEVQPAEKKPFEIEFRIVRPDGAVRWFHATVRIVADDEGKPSRLSGTNLDITNRKLAEQAAKENEALAKALFDAPTDAVFLVATDGTYLDCNEAAARILGKTRAQIVGMKRRSLVPGEAAEQQERRIERLVRTKYPNRFEEDDNASIYDVVMYPIIDASGDVSRIAVIARDVTALRKAEQERSELREQLLHAQKLESLGILAGGIAHDFNNLLTSILGQADLASLALPLSSAARPSLEEIVKTTRRAAGLTNQLLAYSGKGQFVTQSLDLGEVVREMSNMLEVSISKKTTLNLELAPSGSTIDADVSQIRQIIMNLVINASEALAGKTGVVSVTVGARKFGRKFLSKDILGERLSPGTYVYLEVRDSGCGMKPELIEKVFDPFFSTKFAGRGLGLATVLGIVKAHAGAIRVDSVPGKGSTFTILFPPSRGRAEKEEEARDAGLEMAGSGTVLLVDDEEIVRDPASRLLAKLGFTVLTAANGREALEVFRAHKDEIACVILDLTMPEMSGEETFRQLRQIRSDVKVILSSGYGETETIRSFPGRGPEAFIQKPYQLRHLVSKLREVLGEAGETGPAK